MVITQVNPPPDATAGLYAETAGATCFDFDQGVIHISELVVLHPKRVLKAQLSTS